MTASGCSLVRCARSLLNSLQAGFSSSRSFSGANSELHLSCSHWPLHLGAAQLCLAPLPCIPSTRRQSIVSTHAVDHESILAGIERACIVRGELCNASARPWTQPVPHLLSWTDPTAPLMPLSSLHQIELQLIMHALPGDDLFRFARCCKTICAASRSSFAWKHARVEMHVIGNEVEPSLVSRVASAIMSLFHRPIALVIPTQVAAATAVVWAPAALWALDRSVQTIWCAVREEDVDALVRAAQRVSPLQELHLAGFLRGFRTSQWRRIFSHDPIQQLRVLRLDRTLVPRRSNAKPLETVKPLSVYPWLIEVACQSLPHLHTLLEVPETVHRGVLYSIASVPNLTRLSFSCSSGGASADVWEPLSRCPSGLHATSFRSAGVPGISGQRSGTAAANTHVEVPEG